MRAEFLLDSDVVFLNHGSFGACPLPVFERYQQWQRELERQPVEFLARRLPDLLASARRALGDYVGADADDLFFVPNATSGVNVAARAMELRPDTRRGPPSVVSVETPDTALISFPSRVRVIVVEAPRRPCVGASRGHWFPR